MPAPRRDKPPATPTTTHEVTPQMRLQMLSTEHWSLLASRSLAWNESFTRAGMFLSTLSFSVVALALVGQATGFAEGFRLFALVVLPVVLFLGIAATVRMDSANYHDALCVIGMNRIRAAYLELAPDLDRYFVMGSTDDSKGIQATMAVVPGRPVGAHFISATPTVMGVLNSMLVAAIATLAAIQLGVDAGLALVIGGLAFVLASGIQIWLTVRMLDRMQRDYRPLFPGPDA